MPASADDDDDASDRSADSTPIIIIIVIMRQRGARDGRLMADGWLVCNRAASMPPPHVPEPPTAPSGPPSLLPPSLLPPSPPPSSLLPPPSCGSCGSCGSCPATRPSVLDARHRAPPVHTPTPLSPSARTHVSPLGAPHTSLTCTQLQPHSSSSHPRILLASRRTSRHALLPRPRTHTGTCTYYPHEPTTTQAPEDATRGGGRSTRAESEDAPRGAPRRSGCSVQVLGWCPAARSLPRLVCRAVLCPSTIAQTEADNSRIGLYRRRRRHDGTTRRHDGGPRCAWRGGMRMHGQFRLIPMVWKLTAGPASSPPVGR